MRRFAWIAFCAGCTPAALPSSGAPAAPPAPAPEAAEPMPPGAAPVSSPSSPSSVPGDEAAFGGKPASPRPPARPSMAQAMVDAHNRARAKHCAAPLTWSAQLAQVAQRWANALRDKGCAFGHSNGSYGENLAAGTTGTLGPDEVVGMWYDEVAHYKFPDGGFSMATGHFTQVVWRGTRQVGCGQSHCKDMDIFVCEYDPPGNWEGQYRENVRPTGCR